MTFTKKIKKLAESITGIVAGRDEWNCGVEAKKVIREELYYRLGNIIDRK